MADAPTPPRNRIQCLRCHEVVESVHVHHMVWCSCRAVAVDGGPAYGRRLGSRSDWIELEPPVLACEACGGWTSPENHAGECHECQLPMCGRCADAARAGRAAEAEVREGVWCSGCAAAQQR